MKINSNFNNLKPSYLFRDIAQKTAAYKASHPDADIIKMGIGDVTLPLCQAAVTAMENAAREMGVKETFHGYPEAYGEDFLLLAIQDYYKREMGGTVDTNEICVTSGAKEDVANILDIFSTDNTVLIPDPVYPVYYDTNVMDGRKIKFISSNESNSFLPLPDESMSGDIIYLCSPNNPTGAAYTREQLKAWVNFALSHNAVILYDAAYEIFVSEKSCPRSIFEIEGARKCTIEFCSFSKTAGFTGTRCGYTVIPAELIFENTSLLSLWKRRQSTKFNGVAYIIQRGAAAVLTEEGIKQVRQNIDYYRTNTANMMKTFDKLNIKYYGGKNSPYIWLKCPNDMKSWDFFDLLLTKCNVVGTPGEGFGVNGEGYFRLSGFGDIDRTREALHRIETLLG